MRRRIIGLEFFCLAFLLLSHHAIAGGAILTSTQSQSTSPPGVLVATDWGPGTTGITDPLTFDQFNPKLGTLTSIDITLTATIRNDYMLAFPPTPTPTTLYVVTSQTTSPSAVGPTVTFFGPNGTTLGAAIQPVDLVQLTEPSGTWSSLLPITNPNYIPPTMTEQSFSRTLTAADAPSLFSDFIGTGKVDLPVTAIAFSSFHSDSSNGGGAVITTANAVATIQYAYAVVSEPQYAYAVVPEPSSVILLSLGIGLSFLASSRLRRRAACASQSDRT